MKRLTPLLFLAFVACDKFEAGEACWTEGDGFTRTDPCQESCIDWQVTCPDGTAVVPDVCSGGVCSTDADCDEGFVCVQVDMTDAECLPTSTCP